MASIVVPTRKEQAAIAETIRALQALPGEKEILIAIGGSEDRTQAIALELGFALCRPNADAVAKFEPFTLRGPSPGQAALHCDPTAILQQAVAKLAPPATSPLRTCLEIN